MKTGAQVMTMPRGKSIPVGWLAVTLAVSTLAGCNACVKKNTGEDAGAASALKAPVVEALPATSCTATVHVRGTKEAGSGIMVFRSTRQEAEQFVAPNADTTFEGELALDEGSTDVVFFEVDASGTQFGDRTTPVTIARAAAVAIPPTVDSYTENVPLNGAASVELTFNGGKAAGSNLQVDGVEKVAANDQTRWTFTVSFGEGEHTFNLTSKNACGNVSTAVPVTVRLFDLQPPTLNTVTSPTRDATQTISGTKQANTSLKLRRAGQADVEVTGQDMATTWSKTIDLVEGDNAFQVFVTRDMQSSPTVTGHIVRHSMACPAPTVDTYPTVVPMNGMMTVSVSLSGGKDPACNVLLNGVEITPAGDGTVITWGPTSVDVHMGVNTFTLTSSDSLGNTSAATTVAILGSDVAPPTLNPVTSPTSQSSQNISGGMAMGTSVGISINMAAEVQVAAAGGIAGRMYATPGWPSSNA